MAGLTSFAGREITVTVVSTTTTRDDGGDSTATTVETLIPRVLYAPRASQERVSSTQPTVYTAGSLYFLEGLPDGVTLDSDDAVRIVGVHPLVDGTYQVEGIPGYWGGPVEVAVTRTGAV